MAQLRKLDERLGRMKAIHALYRDALSGLPHLRVIPMDLESGVSPQWIDVLAEERDALAECLGAKGMDTRKFWLPIHTQPCYLHEGGYPHATYASAHGLWLPSSFQLTDEDVREVCREIRRFYASPS